MARLEATARQATIPNPHEVAVALKNIRRGQRVIYYVGHLANDRGEKKFQTELDLLHLENANTAWTARAHLVQQRRADGAGFNYIAIGIN